MLGALGGGPLQLGAMIRVVLMLMEPARTWEKIKIAQASVWRLTFMLVLPLLLLSAVVESLGLMQLGIERGALGLRMVKAPLDLVVRYQLVQLALSLLVLFGGAALLRPIGLSFHRRHSYQECFTTLAYCLSPIYLLRMLDALPAVNTWVCFGIGLFLAVSQLYRAIPFILKPDPSSALGLFMLTTVLLVASTGLAHFLAVLVLEEKLFA